MAGSQRVIDIAWLVDGIGFYMENEEGLGANKQLVCSRVNWFWWGIQVHYKLENPCVKSNKPTIFFPMKGLSLFYLLPR